MTAAAQALAYLRNAHSLQGQRLGQISCQPYAQQMCQEGACGRFLVIRGRVSQKRLAGSEVKRTRMRLSSGFNNVTQTSGEAWRNSILPVSGIQPSSVSSSYRVSRQSPPGLDLSPSTVCSSLRDTARVALQLVAGFGAIYSAWQLTRDVDGGAVPGDATVSGTPELLAGCRRHTLLPLSRAHPRRNRAPIVWRRFLAGCGGALGFGIFFFVELGLVYERCFYTTI